MHHTTAGGHDSFVSLLMQCAACFPLNLKGEHASQCSVDQALKHRAKAAVLSAVMIMVGAATQHLIVCADSLHVYAVLGYAFSKIHDQHA